MESFNVTQEQVDKWIDKEYFLEDVIKELTGIDASHVYISFNNKDKSSNKVYEVPLNFKYLGERD